MQKDAELRAIHKGYESPQQNEHKTNRATRSSGWKFYIRSSCRVILSALLQSRFILQVVQAFEFTAI
jgi:hypothetical protein